MGRVVRRYDGLRRAHRRGRGAGFDPSSLGSRLILQDPPRRGSGGFGSRDIRSRSERRRGSSGSGCAAVCRPARTEHVGEGRVPTRLRSDLALFCRIPLAVAREGLDLATSGRDPSGFGGRVGRVVRPCDGLRIAHRRGRGAGTDPSSTGSRLILQDPPRRGSGGGWILRHPVEIRVVSGAGGVGLRGGMTACVYSALTWEMGGFRPVFARISPYFGGSPSPWLGRVWISRHPVEIRAKTGAEWVGLCGGMTACVGRTDVGEGWVSTRLRSDLALFCRIPLAVAREGLDLATSGRDPSEDGGRVGRVVRRYVALRAPSTWEKGGYRPVFARISPYFAGSPSPWLGRA